MKPLVSIILPTYNGAHFITEAIESVFAQTYKQWELLIIVDGSTDQTKILVENLAKNDARILLIENEKNIGIQKSLNKGIAMAKGKYIARLDDDDRWTEPKKISLQVAYLEAHTECVLIGTNASVINASGKILSKNSMPLSDRAIRSRILFKNCFLHATVMIRKEALEKNGGYNEDKRFFHAEDYELWLRLGREGKFANLALYSTVLTFHDQSLTSKNRVLQARNIISTVLLYKKNYPNFYTGIAVAVVRYVGFVVIGIVPIPQQWLHAIQRLYRSV